MKLFNLSKLTTIFFDFLIIFLTLFVLFSVRWLNKNFGEISFDQVLFHLSFGMENLEETDKELVKSFYEKCIYKPFFITSFAFIITYNFEKIKSYVASIFHKINSIYKKIPILLRPSVFFLLASVIYALNNFSFMTFVKDSFFTPYKDFYADLYRFPEKVSIEENNVKNLVLIYVESLENTYENDTLFDNNLLQSINPELLNGISFRNQKQLPGTGWTMAGIVATQCGIPLKSMLGGGDKLKNRLYEDNKNFLPNAKCLGDVLKLHGYKNIFYQGAPVEFAGKGNFFLSHGYSEVKGKTEFLKESPKLPINNWGLYDDDLFEIAKRKIDSLEKDGSRYNLTLLTVDTHQPEGHISSTCRQRGVKEFKGIVRCTAEQIGEFIDYMDKKNYLQKTTVVVMGDHLAMTNPEFSKILKSPNRTIFNLYVSRINTLEKKRDSFVHFDHFPTILDSIGLNVEGGMLALGISGFSSQNTINDAERFKLLQDNVLRKSEIYKQFWQPKLSHHSRDNKSL